MDKHKNLLKMLSGCQHTKDIAALYFPVYLWPEAQIKAFKRTIEGTPGMLAQMTSKGYREDTEFLTPQVIAVIVKFWGLPDEVETALAAEAEGKE